MRYIVNDKNYVVAISFGCDMLYNDCVCNEYTGVIPSGYESLEEWYLEEELTLWRWKITDGNLTLDSSATAPEEGRWGVPDLQDKTVTPTTSEQDVTADEDYDGLRKVTVKRIPESYIIPAGETNITSNGTYDVTQYSSVNVDIASGRIGNAVKTNDYDIYRAVFNVDTENLIGFYLSSPETNFRTYAFDSYPAKVIVAGFYQSGTFTALRVTVINDYGDTQQGVDETTIACSVSDNQITINGCIGNDNIKLYPIYKT